jgi:hypothetical protein
MEANLINNRLYLEIFRSSQTKPKLSWILAYLPMGEEEEDSKHCNRGLGFRYLSTWEEAHGPPPIGGGGGVYALTKLNPMLGLGFHIYRSLKIGHLLSMQFFAHGGECAPP